MFLFLGFLFVGMASIAWSWHWNSDEFGVYEAVVRDSFSGDDVSYFLILDTTQPMNRFGISTFHARELGLASSARVSYCANNLFRFRIPQQLHLPHPFAMVAQKDLDAVYGQGQASNPKIDELKRNLRRSWGVITLSRAGFDAGRRHAVVYAQLTYCGLCGEGLYLYLSKESGVWHVVGRAGTWIS